jgi:polar amino acid transport system substrate-binding protein
MPASIPLEASRRRLLAAAVASVVLTGCAAQYSGPVPRAELAPTGTLRIAVYPGSATSLVMPANEAEMRGVSVDIGRALAQRLGVPAKVVVYPVIVAVIAALQKGEADFTVTNAGSERTRLLDVATPLLQLELGVLVPQGSPLRAVDGMDGEGMIIGVSQNSSSERVLGARFKKAKLRPFPSLAAAAQALREREISGFATNKAVLFELADQVQGSRVFDQSWGTEQFAPAVPKGREAALPFLNAFVEQVRRDGSVSRAAARAGLRGMPLTKQQERQMRKDYRFD